MAIQPSDLGEQFVRSGKRLITRISADALLSRCRETTSGSQKEEPLQQD